MRNFFIIVANLVLFNQILTAQLTLTKAFNEPVIGDVSSFSRWDSVSPLNNNAGTAVVWDFSSLTNNDTLHSSSIYTTVASSPNPSSYSNASFTEFDGFAGHIYWKSSGTSTGTLELLGLTQPSLSVNFNSNSAMAVIWPVAYGYNKTDAFSGSAAAQTSTANLTGTASGNIKTMASGSGTLILPGGFVFTNVLQVKAIQTINVSLLFGLLTATLTSTNYQYYHSSQKFPILTVNYQKTSGGITSETAGIRINTAIPVGINENKFISHFSIYPNPVTNDLKIDLVNKNSENVLITIFNELGASVKAIELGNLPEINTQLHLSDLNTGIYFVKMTVGESSVIKKIIKH